MVINNKKPQMNRPSLQKVLVDNAIYFVLLVLLVLIVIIEPRFMNIRNFQNIFAQSSTKIIIAIGAGMILVVQGVDLSTGRIVGLGAVISASLMQNVTYKYRMYPNLAELPLIVPILVTIVACALIGVLIGSMVAYLKVPPFIATLGSQLVIFGLASLYYASQPSGAQPLGGIDKSITGISTGALTIGSLRIPYLTMIALLIAVIMWGDLEQNALWQVYVRHRRQYRNRACFRRERDPHADNGVYRSDGAVRHRLRAGGRAYRLGDQLDRRRVRNGRRGCLRGRRRVAAGRRGFHRRHRDRRADVHHHQLRDVVHRHQHVLAIYRQRRHHSARGHPGHAQARPPRVIPEVYQMRDVVKNTVLTENCSKETIRGFVDSVLPGLTLEEKIGIMNGQVTEKKLLDDLFVLEHYNVKPYPTLEVKRLGLPNVRFVDGPRGVVAGSATCFPVSMARGATFDRDLEEEIGRAIGAEIRAQGGNYFGGVCINLPRNPRWGRAQECYGEDSYHLGEMGAALTRGVQSQNVMACVKHYAMNSIENARFKANVYADKRTLHEVYLPHFKRCVQEGAASVMGAYNKVYGEQASESRYLLKDILRDKWHFDGFTLSDFLWAVKDGAKAVKNGMNIEMPCFCHYVEDLPKALADGTLDMADVDEAVGYILRTTLYFETRRDPQVYGAELLAGGKHCALARRAAQESQVLLKNEGNVLPLSKEKTDKIVVLGTLGDTENIGDHGSSKVHPYYTVTPLRGLMKKMPQAQILYHDGSDLEKARALAADADAVLIVAGYIHSDEGEFLADRSDIAEKGGDRVSMRLHKRDTDLIRGAGGVCKNTVVSIIGSSAILIDEWVDEVPAVLFSFYSGMEGGNALADILFGDVCPGGKLPYTVAVHEDDYPFFDPDCEEITYEYYHGYAKMEKEGIAVSYPYGYGLSYTSLRFPSRKSKCLTIRRKSALP